MDDKKQRTALLLINVGTPDQPTLKAVKRYLSEFLNDKYVIPIPWLFRRLLVDLVIVPFKAKKSVKLYRQLWTPDGSPLLVHTENLKRKLQEKTGNDYTVFTAMRYRKPSIASALNSIREQGFQQLIVLPLYPQFAAATTLTATEEVKRVIKQWDATPDLYFVEPFYTHPAYLDAFTRQIRSYKPEEYDYVLFSFHGLPNSHIQKAHARMGISACRCEAETSGHGRFCYRAASYHTAKLLAEHLNLRPDSYGISFQSRLSKSWLAPFTDATLADLAKKGIKRVLVAAPSFVSDNLETTVELGIAYKKLFIANGGEKLTVVESLNANDDWADGIIALIAETIR